MCFYSFGIFLETAVPIRVMNLTWDVLKEFSCKCEILMLLNLPNSNFSPNLSRSNSSIFQLLQTHHKILFCHVIFQPYLILLKSVPFPESPTIEIGDGNFSSHARRGDIFILNVLLLARGNMSKKAWKKEEARNDLALSNN